MIDHPIDDLKNVEADFASLARLATRDSAEDVRLFLGKIVRKYRMRLPELAEKVNDALRAASRPSTLLRRAEPDEAPEHQSFRPTAQRHRLPQDNDTSRSLVWLFDDLESGLEAPILEAGTREQLEAIVRERLESEKLRAHGVPPTRSAFLVGPPGVGKTLSARWLAYRLGKPLWVLDLTTVMSSLLGRTGNNLRTVFDHAKEQGAVLLLDEIDALAKSRSDESDVGELKRLVTGLLQEVDAWPDSSLLLAATNHPELIDPALWRRFDAVLHFQMPDDASLRVALERFLGGQGAPLSNYVPLLAVALKGQSLSDIQRFVLSLRRALLLNEDSVVEVIAGLTARHAEKIGKPARIDLAIELAKTTELSHNRIMELTGVARDTIRKHAGPSARRGRGLIQKEP